MPITVVGAPSVVPIHDARAGPNEWLNSHQCAVRAAFMTPALVTIPFLSCDCVGETGVMNAAPTTAANGRHEWARRVGPRRRALLTRRAGVMNGHEVWGPDDDGATGAMNAAPTPHILG